MCMIYVSYSEIHEKLALGDIYPSISSLWGFLARPPAMRRAVALHLMHAICKLEPRQYAPCIEHLSTFTPKITQWRYKYIYIYIYLYIYICIYLENLGQEKNEHDYKYNWIPIILSYGSNSSWNSISLGTLSAGSNWGTSLPNHFCCIGLASWSGLATFHCQSPAFQFYCPHSHALSFFHIFSHVWAGYIGTSLI